VFIQYLLIARGSAAETRSLLYTGLDVGYIDKDQFCQLSQQCQTVSGLLNGFISYLKNYK
jgi:four helix bundle protein